jgi:predicted neuraminidase
MRFELSVKEMIFPADSIGQPHASTLLRLKDGCFLASCFSGSKEGATDVAIFGFRRENGIWGKPSRWARANNEAHWNPVLFQAPGSERIDLYFKTGVFCDVWRTWRCFSIDSGLSWSKPEELVKGDVGGRGPVKNKPIALSDGALLAPASLELGGRWRCFADRSEDGGATWSASPEIPMDKSVVSGKGAIQPSLWETAPGKVSMLARTSCNWICRSDSADGGRTWSQMLKIEIPNNNSGLDLAQAEDGSLLLACNPVAGDFGPRTPLSLFVSRDKGESWSKELDLETAPGEYSYPAVIATPEGFAGTYTWQRRAIAFWQGRFIS